MINDNMLYKKYIEMLRKLTSNGFQMIFNDEDWEQHFNDNIVPNLKDLEMFDSETTNPYILDIEHLTEDNLMEKLIMFMVENDWDLSINMTINLTKENKFNVIIKNESEMSYLFMLTNTCTLDELIQVQMCVLEYIDFFNKTKK